MILVPQICKLCMIMKICDNLHSTMKNGHDHFLLSPFQLQTCHSNSFKHQILHGRTVGEEKCVQNFCQKCSGEQTN